MSRLIETIQLCDGQLNLMALHEARVLRSCQEAFGERPRWNLRDVASSLGLPATGLYKFRIAYDARSAETSVTPYTIRPTWSLKIVESNSIDYHLKWENRSAIDELMGRREGADDILIVKDGYVTDSSIANILFERDEQWFTPATCLLQGITREDMLRRGLIREEEISVGDIHRYKRFKLINAMMRDAAEPSDVSNIR